MLARLPSSLPRAATSLSRSTTTSVRGLPSCARFNSSEATPAPTPDVEASSQVQAESAPKKRAIPLAESLGGISISKKRGQGKNRGPRKQAWEGGGDAQQRQGRPPRRDNGFRRDGQAQIEPRPLRSRPAYTVSRPIAPRQWQENAVPSEEAAETVAETQEVKDVPVTPSPAHPKVHLGDLDDLFGSPVPFASSTQSSTSKPREVTPSQARVQLLLERTGGDYSRYVPRPFPNTTVKELGPLGVAEFTLAYQRDVTPRSRQNALAVVKKFMDRRAQAAAA
ncbi:hypothetical protein GSI_06054 [Ganoderma sinense ZZ0214-1]|uniref:Uncharacterized protein n=1 Tax=Ganoderma sinense ZZ0214-1 TaxID=1077348 RepID=A0A2G8SC62_9APHY|nr:hypothetical protein GSI_06054 [Ganoderma sinense ZZ0214-1]